MTLYDSPWPPSTLKLLVRVESDEATGKDLAEWGMDALVAGFDSPALRRLAGLTADPGPSRFDAEPEFRLAAREIGMPDFRREDILLAFMDECAKAIADGAINLDELLHTIHEVVIDPLDHPEDLMSWCYARGVFRWEILNRLAKKASARSRASGSKSAACRAESHIHARRSPVSRRLHRRNPERRGSESRGHVHSAISALDDVDIFNLLCLPGLSTRAVLDEAISYCRDRRAFLFVDAPQTAGTPDEMLALVTGPWTVSTPAECGRRPAGTDAPLGLRVFPVCGTVAWSAR